MTNILLVDSHPVVREGLKQTLSKNKDYRVVGDIGSGVEIFEFIRKNNVDFIISEIDLPELNGITALRAIKKEHKSIKILMFAELPLTAASCNGVEPYSSRAMTSAPASKMALTTEEVFKLAA